MINADMIAYRPDLRIGDINYLPADRVDLDWLLRHRVLDETQIKSLEVQGWYGPATSEQFSIALARRPADAPFPPRGFTEAYLEQIGVWSPPATAKPEPAAGRTGPDGVIARVQLDAHAIVVGDNRIQPKKRGHFTFYDVTDATGRLLRPAAFRSEEKARAFLDSLGAASTSGAPAATSGKPPAGDGDDGDLRSEPGR
jgi:hypothetical protein